MVGSPLGRTGHGELSTSLLREKEDHVMCSSTPSELLPVPSLGERPDWLCAVRLPVHSGQTRQPGVPRSVSCPQSYGYSAPRSLGAAHHVAHGSAGLFEDALCGPGWGDRKHRAPLSVGSPAFQGPSSVPPQRTAWAAMKRPCTTSLPSQDQRPHSLEHWPPLRDLSARAGIGHTDSLPEQRTAPASLCRPTKC